MTTPQGSTSPAQPTPIRTVEQLVTELMEINDEIGQLGERAQSIRAQLVEQIGVGNEVDVNGVKASVRAPSRSFDLARAWEALTPEQQALAVDRSSKKVKAFLPPVVAETFMKPGKGSPTLVIR